MQITDPIADLLTRIRNASTAKHPSVEIPASNMKKAICQILVDEGYIKGMQVKNDTVQGTIVVTLKYQANGEPLSLVCAACPSRACASTPTARICRRS